MGLYQYYYQSCSVGQLGDILAKSYRELIEQTKKKEFDSLKEKEQTTRKKTAINKKYKGSLIHNCIFRKDELKKILSELKLINNFQFDIPYLDIKENEFTPLDPFVTKTRKILTFTKEGTVKIISDVIAKVANKAEVTDGTIHGEDNNGLERIIKLTNNPEHYGQYDFDEIADKLNNLNIKKFEDSWLIDELLNICKEHAEIFEAQIK